MKKIQLGGHKKRNGKLLIGGYALVDDDDFERLNIFHWSINKHHGCFYARRGATKAELDAGYPRQIRMHREIMGFPPALIDHIDLNGLNNQRENLRFCTNSENLRNGKKRPNISGYRNVYWDKKSGKWRAMIVKDGVNFSFGFYTIAKEAGRVAAKARKKLHGEFAAE